MFNGVFVQCEIYVKQHRCCHLRMNHEKSLQWWELVRCVYWRVTKKHFIANLYVSKRCNIFIFHFLSFSLVFCPLIFAFQRILSLCVCVSVEIESILLLNEPMPFTPGYYSWCWVSNLQKISALSCHLFAPLQMRWSLSTNKGRKSK